jgi:hypothetical protein
VIFDAYVNPSAGVAALSGIAARAQVMTPAFALIRELLFQGFQRNWVSRGAAFGAAWAANAPGTRARKAREGQEGLMRATGALERAMTGGGQGRVGRVTKTTVRAGASGRTLFYARFLQSGSANMPARQIVGIDQPTRVAAVGIMNRYLISGGA